MIKSNINIAIEADDNNMPEQIEWAYFQDEKPQPAATDALLLAIWDKQDKRSLHVDLWTKELTMSEMHQLIFQTMTTMADTYSRATGNKSLSTKMAAMLNELEKDLAEQS